MRPDQTRFSFPRNSRGRAWTGMFLAMVTHFSSSFFFMSQKEGEREFSFIFPNIGDTHPRIHITAAALLKGAHLSPPPLLLIRHGVQPFLFLSSRLFT